MFGWSWLRRGLRLAPADPVEFYRTLKRHVRTLVLTPQSGPIKIKGVLFEIDLKCDPAMKDMFFGSYQVPVVRVLRRFLRRGDTFIDVGANVGYLTALALGLVGKTGQVHAFEPVPVYFQKLERLRRQNPGFQLVPNAAALGNKECTSLINVTNLPNMGWNTMVPGFMRADDVREHFEVPVVRLDEYLAAKAIPRLRLIKIDTEGYEFPVLEGLEAYLRTAAAKPILVVEIAPAAYPLLNISLEDLQVFLQQHGYTSWSMDQSRSIDVRELKTTTDVLLLPSRPPLP